MLQDPPPGSRANPLPVHLGTPCRACIEPSAGSILKPTGSPDTKSGGFARGPQLRSLDKEGSKTATLSRFPEESSLADRAAALLEEKGVEASVARHLAEAYPYEHIVDVIATMEYRQVRGKCENPGGFIRDALVKQWETPRAVVEARTRAEARVRSEAAEQLAKASAHQEAAKVGQEEARIERLISTLDDEELSILAQSVLEKYQGNVAVTRVLTLKPPRQCRLMKMEIAGMLEHSSR